MVGGIGRGDCTDANKITGALAKSPAPFFDDAERRGTMRLNTHFFETYAMISLADLLGERYAGLENLDRPDLQDPRRGIGIEVTRAMDETREKELEMEDEIAGRTRGMRRFMQLGESFSRHAEEEGAIYAAKWWNMVLSLKRAMEKKVGRLQSGAYGNFDEFGLYIFSADDLTLQEAAGAMEEMNRLQNGAALQYAKLFLNQIQKMYVCDLERQTIQEYYIKEEKQQFYFETTLRRI